VYENKGEHDKVSNEKHGFLSEDPVLAWHGHPARVKSWAGEAVK
jgi:hypothetical protein